MDIVMATAGAWQFDGAPLLRRQQGGGDNGTAPPQGNGNNGPPGSAPLTVYTFIIAIALFVLVVSFVLLRIFVRNRRLRQLGLYPESPIERLLGGAPRDFEDTLPPPKLWDAKIADVRASNSSALARAEKSVLGGGVGAGDVKEYGWDALMPVSAALPPSLYPIIYQHDQSAPVAQELPSSPSQNVGRLGRRMPNFLRRSTNEAAETVATAGDANDVPTTGPHSHMAANAQRTETSNEEKVASSVNITVLIAMPSPKTVFPSSRRALNTSTAPLRRSTSKLNGSGILASPRDKLEEVNEDVDMDSLSSKGKARRAPSLRSIRTTASTKSQGEARREAFFSAQAETSDGINPAQPGSNKVTLPSVEPRPYDDEEEELPELVFGTASVPLYSKIDFDNAKPRGESTLIPPTREEILALLSAASDARSHKPRSTHSTKAKSDDADGEGAAANRRSVAGTSMEGGMSAVEEQSGMGDVVSRMMRGDQSSTEAYEMGNISRPSMMSGPSASFVGDEPRRSTASAGLMAGMAPMGVDEIDTPASAASDNRPVFSAATPAVTTPGISGTAASRPSTASTADFGPTARSSTSLHTARDRASSPARTATDRQSTSSWHTGNEEDEVAQVAAYAINFDEDEPSTTSTTSNRRP